LLKAATIVVPRIDEFPGGVAGRRWTTAMLADPPMAAKRIKDGIAKVADSFSRNAEVYSSNRPRNTAAKNPPVTADDQDRLRNSGKCWTAAPT
jgi:hypothetical protein